MFYMNNYRPMTCLTHLGAIRKIGQDNTNLSCLLNFNNRRKAHRLSFMINVRQANQLELK